MISDNYILSFTYHPKQVTELSTAVECSGEDLVCGRVDLLSHSLFLLLPLKLSDGFVEAADVLQDRGCLGVQSEDRLPFMVY